MTAARQLNDGPARARRVARIPLVSPAASVRLGSVDAANPGSPTARNSRRWFSTGSGDRAQPNPRSSSVPNPPKTGLIFVIAFVALGLFAPALATAGQAPTREFDLQAGEAAKALGHGYISAMRFVIMPQGVRNALPPLINHSVSLFKNSSLAIVVGASELTHAVKEIDNVSFRTFEIYLIGTVIYLFFSLIIMALGAYIALRSDPVRRARA